MDCKELTELITEYLENKMPEEERERFVSHTKSCQVCYYYLRQMELTVEALGRVPSEPLPSEAKEAFSAAFQNWKKNNKKS